MIVRKAVTLRLIVTGIVIFRVLFDVSYLVQKIVSWILTKSTVD